MEGKIDFFALVEKEKVFRLLQSEFNDLELYSPEELDIVIDSKHHPKERFFIEVRFKEEENPNFAAFRALKAITNSIIVFPKHQLHDCHIVNGVIHSSTTISPWKWQDIKDIANKEKNFAMVKLETFLPQGTVKFINGEEWNQLQKKSIGIGLYNGKVPLSKKLLIEKLSPTSVFTTKDKIQNENYLERYFLPGIWSQIIDEELTYCRAMSFREEEINNLLLKATAIKAKLQILREKQKLLSA